MREIILRLKEIEREINERAARDNLSRYNTGETVHLKQLAFHKCLKKNRWVFGGNRSGKTECGAAEERFNDVFLAEKAQKTIEINDEEQALIRDLFKYNNGLDEKEQRYANVIKQTNANLEIKYLQVESNYFGKDQLIEMGYYEDAIDCVCAYYDLLPPADAFGDIKTESKLMIYLDEYYQTLVYMYKTRAGL